MNLLPAPTRLEASSINAISKSQDWKDVIEYLVRAQAVLDSQLRVMPAERLGKIQGAAQVVEDFVKLPEACRDILKQHT